MLDAVKIENSFGHINYLCTLEDRLTKQRWEGWGIRLRAVSEPSSALWIKPFILPTPRPSVITVRCKALFKPAVEGNCEGWHRVTAEAAAYHLNLLLGMDYVPPSVCRSRADVDWQHFPHGGAFIYWCTGAEALPAVPTREWGCCPEVLLSDTRILVGMGETREWGCCPEVLLSGTRILVGVG